MCGKTSVCEAFCATILTADESFVVRQFSGKKYEHSLVLAFQMRGFAHFLCFTSSYCKLNIMNAPVYAT